MDLVLRHERFKDAREDYNQYDKQTIEEVEEITGVSHSFIGRAEKDDDCSLGSNNVVALAKHYGVSTDFLLGVDPSPHHNDDLSAAIKESGLSYKIMKNIQNTKNELTQEAFEILTYILSSPVLSDFIVKTAYSITHIQASVDFAHQVISNPKATFPIDGKPADHRTLLESDLVALENERFRLEYSWIEFLKGLCDIDASRSEIQKCLLDLKNNA